MHIPSTASSYLALAAALAPLGSMAGVLLPGRVWKRQFPNGTPTPGPDTNTSTPFFTLVAISQTDEDINNQPVVCRGGYCFIDPVSSVPPPPPPATRRDGDGRYGDVEERCNDTTTTLPPTVFSTNGEGGACVVQLPPSPDLSLFLLADTGILSYLLDPTVPPPPNAAFTTFGRLGPGDSPTDSSGLLRSVFDWLSVREDLTTPGWFGCPVPTAADANGDQFAGLRLVKQLTPGMSLGIGCRGPWELGVINYFV